MSNPREYPTFGIEEEYLILDSETGFPSSKAQELLEVSPFLRRHAEQEFLTSQLETATPICRLAEEAEVALASFRANLRKEASKRGLIVAPTGLPPIVPSAPAEVTAQDRYFAIGESIRSLVAKRYSTGMHVHVAIPSPEAGIRVMRGMAEWMPLLLALSGNSPLWEGEDTGFTSWRYISDLRWPVAGYPPMLTNADEYFHLIECLQGGGVIGDKGMVNWSIRLSQRFPTAEIRIADAQLTVKDSVAFGTIVRALIVRILRENTSWGATSPMTSTLVESACWQAARDGMNGRTINPLTGDALSSSQRAEDLLAFISGELSALGDSDRVAEYIDRRMSASPSEIQRRAFESGGVREVLDLYSRV